MVYYNLFLYIPFKRILSGEAEEERAHQQKLLVGHDLLNHRHLSYYLIYIKIF